MEEKETHDYDDLIHLPHHVSSVHPQMSLQDRAAQFSPFAALTGYEDAVEETARLTERRLQLSEDEKEILDLELRALEHMGQQPSPVAVTYFVADSRKEGGTYVTKTGKVRKIHRYRRVLIMEDGLEIPVDDIRAIQRQEE